MFHDQNSLVNLYFELIYVFFVKNSNQKDIVCHSIVDALLPFLSNNPPRFLQFVKLFCFHSSDLMNISAHFLIQSLHSGSLSLSESCLLKILSSLLTIDQV
jgi:hypothetical protein